MRELLLRKQAELGLTESEFAKKLHIKRQTWHLTATKYKRVGETVLSAALAAFEGDEEVERAAAEYLRELANARTPIGTSK